MTYLYMIIYTTWHICTWLYTLRDKIVEIHHEGQGRTQVLGQGGEREKIVTYFLNSKKKYRLKNP